MLAEPHGGKIRFHRQKQIVKWSYGDRACKKSRCLPYDWHFLLLLLQLWVLAGLGIRFSIFINTLVLHLADSDICCKLLAHWLTWKLSKFVALICGQVDLCTAVARHATTIFMNLIFIRSLQLPVFSFTVLRRPKSMGCISVPKSQLVCHSFFERANVLKLYITVWKFNS